MIKVGEPIQGSDKEKGLRRERELNWFFYLELLHLLRFQIHSLNSQMGQDPRSFSSSGQSQGRVAHILGPPPHYPVLQHHWQDKGESRLRPEKALHF